MAQPSIATLKASPFWQGSGGMLPKKMLNFHCWKAFDAGNDGSLGSYLTEAAIFYLKILKCARINSFLRAL